MSKKKQGMTMTVRDAMDLVLYALQDGLDHVSSKEDRLELLGKLLANLSIRIEGEVVRDPNTREIPLSVDPLKFPITRLHPNELWRDCTTYTMFVARMIKHGWIGPQQGPVLSEETLRMLGDS